MGDAFSAISFNLNDENFHLDIEAITYRNFSKVSCLVNNDTKTVYGVWFHENDVIFNKVKEILINHYNADANSFK